MNCSEVRNYISANGKVEDNKEIQKHIEHCDQCKNFYAMAQSAKIIFKETKMLSADAVFTESFHKTLKNEYEKKASFSNMFLRRIYFILPLLAFIFTLAFFFITEHSDAYRENNMELISTSTVSAGEPITVTMVYVADSSYSDTTVSIVLPEGVSFYSSNEKIESLKELNWNGTLKKGENKIPFVVTLKDSGIYNIMTKAVYDKHVHAHKVVLQADSKNIVISMYKINDVSI